MARMRLPLRHNVLLAACVLAWPAAVAAEDIGVSAKIDKTTAQVREPITLSVTLTGDIAGTELLPPQLPEGIIFVGRSQATNVSLHAGTAEQSSTITYLLVPQRPGTFSLGPFSFRHRGKLYQTDPIEITVKKAVLPPTRQAPSERYTL